MNISWVFHAREMQGFCGWGRGGQGGRGGLFDARYLFLLFALLSPSTSLLLLEQAVWVRK